MAVAKGKDAKGGKPRGSAPKLAKKAPARAAKLKRCEMVNILAAKSALSKLVAAVESGETEEIILARNGKPAARIVPLAKGGIIIGIAKGKFVGPDIDPELDREVEKLFYGR